MGVHDTVEMGSTWRREKREGESMEKRGEYTESDTGRKGHEEECSGRKAYRRTCKLRGNKFGVHL